VVEFFSKMQNLRLEIPHLKNMGAKSKFWVLTFPVSEFVNLQLTAGHFIFHPTFFNSRNRAKPKCWPCAGGQKKTREVSLP